MAAYHVVGGHGADDDGLIARTRYRLHAEEAFRAARVAAAGEDMAEFAHMLAVATRRPISEAAVIAWELGVGDAMPADVLLAACYLCQQSVSDLIGFGAQTLDRLERRLARLEGHQPTY